MYLIEGYAEPVSSGYDRGQISGIRDILERCIGGKVTGDLSAMEPENSRLGPLMRLNPRHYAQLYRCEHCSRVSRMELMVSRRRTVLEISAAVNVLLSAFHGSDGCEGATIDRSAH